MRIQSLFKLMFITNIIFSLVSIPLLPHRIATHFGRGGYPNGWAPTTTHVMVFIIFEVAMFLLFVYSPQLILKSPPKLINLPNKDYWLKPENQFQLKTNINDLMSEFGIAFFTFFLIIKLLTFEANRSEPVRLNENLFLIALILFLAYSVYWSIKLIRSFKIPEKMPSTQ